MPVLLSLLEKQGFQVKCWEYAPRCWATLWYELQLYLCWKLGLPLFSHWYNRILSPLCCLDPFLGGRGNAVVVKAVKQ